VKCGRKCTIPGESRKEKVEKVGRKGLGKSRLAMNGSLGREEGEKSEQFEEDGVWVLGVYGQYHRYR
jgi:hypothetical protein